jgi:hypothetical protein
MIDRRRTHDRRSEPRFQTVGRIQWRPNHSAQAFKGYISDSSKSGLSFLAGRSSEPRIGEQVELDCPRALHPVWKVVRVEDYDSNLCLIACEALPAPDRVPPRLWRLRSGRDRIS